MILVGIDERSGAGDALALGRVLSEARGDDLLLAWVHPYEELPSLLGSGPETEQVRGAIDALAEAVRASLPAEMRPELRLVSGRSAADGLARLAEAEGAEIIVVGPSERAGLGRILPGRTAVRLLSGSATPVAIAPRGYEERASAPQVIGVGFDASAEADQAFDCALALARPVGASLRLIAVHEAIPYARAGVGTLPTEAVSQVLRRDLREAVAKALEGTGDVNADTAFGEGDAGAFLIEQSADLDLLVLGSRGYGPVRAVLLGTVSEAVLSGSASPVLVVPRGHATEAS